MFLVNGLQEMKVDGSLSKAKAVCLNGLLVTDCSKTKPHSRVMPLIVVERTIVAIPYPVLCCKEFAQLRTQGRARRVAIVEYGCREPHPPAPLLIKEMAPVYRRIHEQTQSYLLENYDLAPAKIRVKMKILLFHAAVRPLPPFENEQRQGSTII